MFLLLQAKHVLLPSLTPSLPLEGSQTFTMEAGVLNTVKFINAHLNQGFPVLQPQFD